MTGMQISRTFKGQTEIIVAVLDPRGTDPGKAACCVHVFWELL